MGRRVSAARVKSNRSYSVEELAEALGVTPQTVRSWIRQGLPALTGQRPYLVLGCAFKAFVARTDARRRQPLALGEFFCLRCKAPRKAALAYASYRPTTDTYGRLEALCTACEGACGRIVSAASLAEWGALYEIDRNDAAHA
jgi:hypothetical protein